MILNKQTQQYFSLFITAVLLSLLSICAQAQTIPQAQRPAKWATPVNTEFNLHQIDNQLFRSAQPQAKHIDQIKALGIKTIISFRAFHSDKNLLGNTDIELINIPINTWSINDSHVIQTLNAIERAKKRGNVLIHCQHGADRTGLMSAMYRMVQQGWSKEEALKELTDGNYGYHTVWGNIPKYIQQVNLTYLIQRLEYSPMQNK